MVLVTAPERKEDLAAPRSASVPHVEHHDFRALVLCYHSVSDEWEHALAVTWHAFERQLRSLLRRGFRPLPAGELLAGPRRGLHVTFDDAYRTILDALPTLRRLGLPTTVFASTAFADGGRPLDVPELAAEAAAHPGHLATMTWDELRGLAADGVEIGSHTVSHPHLPRLSEVELDRELRDSRARVEDELGRPCRLFAYPYGEHGERVQAAVRRAGYEAAFALGEGASPGNPYALPRVDLYRRDSLLRATLKTSFVKPHGSALLARLRTRSA
jgi:peptidoglycan/xylan/chitin deacetylase (PgdA/CDA1 family)